MRSFRALCCVCGVLGLLAPVHRCARSVRCLACAISWATWLLLTGVHARCVLLRVPCPGPVGSCSPMRLLRALCCLSCVLGHLAPVHRFARSMRCVACATSWVRRLLFTGVPPESLGSCSPVCSLGALCCVCGVLGHRAPVHRCAHSLRCVACAASRGSWLLFTAVPVRCVVLLKHLGGGQPPSLPWHARPQTHEIQDFFSNLGISKEFWDPCLGHDTIWRPGQGDEGICRQRKHVDK